MILKKKKNLTNLFLNRSILSFQEHRFAEKDETDVDLRDTYAKRLHGCLLPGKKTHGEC